MQTNDRYNQPRLPRWADRLLEWFCAPHLLEEVQGDMQELYGKWVRQHGVKKARWLYAFHTIKFFRPYSLKRLSINNPTDMLKNYFIIALRNLLKQKLYSFINIGGLAVGLACFLLIMLFVQHELSYDRFYKNADHIYRIIQRQPGNVYMGTDYFAVTPAPLASTLVAEFPEVTYATTITNQPALLSLDEQHYWEEGLWADAHFFDVFAFPLLQGNPETVLAQSHSIVLTASLAHKIFGDEDPMGQTLVYQKGDPYTVTGVMSDLPENSSFKYDFITAIQSEPRYMSNLQEQRWDNNSWHTFFSLAHEADPQQLQAKMPALVEKYKLTEEEAKEADEYFIQALTDIHLQSNINFDVGRKGNKKYIYLFSTIAFLILMLACVNYMNLAVARSIKRAREVGLRKVVGALRWQLITQYLGESVLMAFLALVLALGLAQWVLPIFGHLVDRPIDLEFMENKLLLPGLLVLVVLAGLISGSYPALFMSSLRPAQVLKGKMAGSASRFRLQRWLIVGQYAVSIALVASSFVIYQQLQYVQHKELSYDKEHVVTVQVQDPSLIKNYETIRNEWLQDAHIMGVTASGHLPTNIMSNTNIKGWEGSYDDEILTIYQTPADYDFLKVFGIELVAGRTFSREVTSDLKNVCLINETAAHAMGWTPEEAISQQFYYTWGGEENRIIGVVKDFHLHSLHLPIQPLMIMHNTDWIRYISVKVRPDDLPRTIAMLKQTVKRFSPYPFEYQFLDEHFDQLYKSDLRLGETFGFFTILALLIASLGLFGLAAFTAEQRTKEVGIRKVLGASVHSIVTLLTKDFLSMVALAFLLATPVAWSVMHQWLQDFAYRINLQWWMFVLPGVLALLIAWLTVSFQSIKAAITNPVDSLRNE